ncbi:MAG: hypothetical protein ABII27_07615 [bacterium]
MVKKVLGIILLLVISTSLYAKESEATLAFADYLYKKSEFSRAVTEYYRVIYSYPFINKGGLVSLKLAMAYASMKEFGKAEGILNEILEGSLLASVKYATYIALAKCYYHEKRYSLAIEEASNAFNEGADGSLAVSAKSLITWSYLSQNCWLDAAQFQEEHGATEVMVQNIREGSMLPKKSPRIAGWLSFLLPGAGQVYAGRWGDGIVSFLINAAFGFAIYDSFRNDNKAAGWVFSVFELGWYSGNIYTGIGSAHRTNKVRTERYFEFLEETGLESPNMTYELP